MLDKDKYITSDYIIKLFNHEGHQVRMASRASYFDAHEMLDKHLDSKEKRSGAIMRVLSNASN